MPETYEMLY